MAPSSSSLSCAQLTGGSLRLAGVLQPVTRPAHARTMTPSVRRELLELRPLGSIMPLSPPEGARQREYVLVGALARVGHRRVAGVDHHVAAVDEARILQGKFIAALPVG